MKLLLMVQSGGCITSIPPPICSAFYPSKSWSPHSTHPHRSMTLPCMARICSLLLNCRYPRRSTCQSMGPSIIYPFPINVPPRFWNPTGQNGVGSTTAFGPHHESESPLSHHILFVPWRDNTQGTSLKRKTGWWSISLLPNGKRITPINVKKCQDGLLK